MLHRAPPAAKGLALLLSAFIGFYQLLSAVQIFAFIRLIRLICGESF